MNTPTPAPASWCARLFGMSRPLARRPYIIAGVVLLPLKYAVEASVLLMMTGKFYSPVDYVNPLLSSRVYFTADAPEWLGMAWVVWSLPFLWLAVTFSIRRAYDAALSPWLGLLMLVPIVNLLLMVALAIPPTGYFTLTDDEAEAVASVYKPTHADAVLSELPEDAGWKASMMGLAAGALYLLTLVVISVYALGSYGSALFFGTPILTGAVAAYVLNRGRPRSLGATLGHSTLTLSIACFAFLLLGLEGIICIVMALPIMLPLGLFGAFVGRGIAISLYRPGHTEQHGLVGCVLLLPLVAWVETRFDVPTTYEVVSCVEIDAPVDVVWDNVVDFPEIDAAPAWYFQLGIAYPTQAHIDGHGVGAKRYCEFTTGTFVEPITAWERPTRLAFDVTEQPEPMFELTPYRHIHPPHLTGSFRSLRGEFRLLPLGAARTRLEGSTWYQLDIHPRGYWTIWTDWILHRIHHRVLVHIKAQAESRLGS